MKKIFVSVMAFLLTTLFCSCGIPAQKQECFSVPENFICDLFVTEGGTDYVGRLERNDGAYKVTVVSPDSLSGLCVEYENGDFIAQYPGSEMTLTPKETFFMKEIMEFLEKPENEECAVLSGGGDAYIIENGAWRLSFPVE